MTAATKPERVGTWADRPKTLTGRGRKYPVDGAALDAAMRATGATNVEVGDALAIAPPRVSGLRNGEDALTWERVRDLPDAVFDALVQAERARRDAKREAEPENHLALAAELADDPSVALLVGLSDGHFTRAEIAAVDEKANAMRRALAKWERFKAAVQREGVVAVVIGGVRRP